MGGGQAPFIYAGRACLVDQVYQMEYMDVALSSISDALQITFNVPHINKTEHKNYRKYYNGKTKRMIAEVCAKDIELFNYRF